MQAPKTQCRLNWVFARVSHTPASHAQDELAKFCKAVPHGNARAIRCLQDNKAEKDFGKACKEEVCLKRSLG